MWSVSEALDFYSFNDISQHIYPITDQVSVSEAQYKESCLQI